MSYLGYKINVTLECSIGGCIRFSFRNAIFPTVMDYGSILWFWPSKYPSLLLDMKWFEPEVRLPWK
jgi:hypothetical protein